ncbi:tyrosine-type recombinase/integrase [Oribacterium sp. WCC10]|uniref:tyrosine-type recombinase/integrase n=1 Tax=Oribacterium sp. WCC10 TaxID=1855343 RepID=UPI0008EA89A2|nr:tyrosine-type recombinase/integrase [Oribacterium sp. WCC10]SFG31238.1 Phage integrase family protein [Oribacterium sp. WCC10]
MARENEFFKHTEIKYRKHCDKYNIVYARATFCFLNDTSKRLEASGATEKDAYRKLMEKADIVLKEIRYGYDYKAGALALKDSVQELLKQKKDEFDFKKRRTAVKDSTIQPIERSCQTFIYEDIIGKKKVSEITYKDLVNWRNRLSTARYDIHRLKKGKHKMELKYYSSTHLNRAVKIIKLVMHNYYKGVNEKNPADNLELFPQPNVHKTPDNFLIGKEFDLFVDYCKEKQKHKKTELMADYFMTLLFTASREGECASLHAEDYLPETNELYFRRNWTEETYDMKTINSINSIPLIEPALSIIKKRCANKEPSDRIFATMHGNLLSPGNIYNVMSKWIKEAGIEKKLKPHALRGSMAIHLMDNGVPPQAVADYLRDTLETVMKYYYTLTEQAREKRRTVLVDALSLMESCKE